ncbi:MAG TPA: glycosyltransferase [Chloroflexia bacterium]|nr:glycosyltransferase [Chloroflexia bacterium]
MHILHVTSIYYPELQFGGPPQKIHSLGRELVKRGHDVLVVTTHSARPRERRSIKVNGVGVQYVPWIGRGTRQLTLAPLAVWDAVRWADVVHLFGLYNLLCPFAALCARRIGVPYLLEPLGMYVPRARSIRAKRLYHRIFTERMARGAARVIATSPAEAKELEGLIDKKRIVLRRNGIDLAPFEEMPDGTPFRVRYNMALDERVVLYIGRISPIKNLEQFVIAFHQASPRQTRLVLAGPALETDYDARVRALIRRLELDDRVLMPGPLYGRGKLEALAAADLFVLPSISESFGNAAAEAVAAGVPVLLTEGCGIAPLIHSRAGLAVPLNTGAIADGICTMLDDPARREELIRRRPEVLAELSWQEPIDQAERVYREVVGSVKRDA